MTVAILSDWDSIIAYLDIVFSKLASFPAPNSAFQYRFLFVDGESLAVSSQSRLMPGNPVVSSIDSRVTSMFQANGKKGVGGDAEKS